MSNNLSLIKNAIISGKHKEIEDLVRAAIKEDLDLDSLINDTMIGAMDIVGQQFADNVIYVPEMLVSAMTMKKGLEIIKPLLQDAACESKGTIIMCTVKGDMHDIGKNLVIMMLEGAGFNVIDLGVDLSVEKLIERVEEINPDVLGLSALLTTTMPEMKKVIETLEEKGMRNKVKVIVGGAPVNAAFAQKIDADGYGADATEAVKQARSLIGTH